MAVYSYTIAINWNNAAGLANVEAINPTGSASTWLLPYPFNAAYIAVNMGIGTWRANYDLTNAPSVARNGNEMVTWEFHPMAYSAYMYMISTYIIATNGRITIGTTGVSGAITYTNQNASVMNDFSKPNELEMDYLSDGTTRRVWGAKWNLALLGAPS